MKIEGFAENSTKNERKAMHVWYADHIMRKFERKAKVRVERVGI